MRVDLAGDLDRERLRYLRTELRLRPTGRHLGERVDEVPGGRVELILGRDDAGGPWWFQVTVQSGVPGPAALDAVAWEASAVAQAGGLTVTGAADREARPVLRLAEVFDAADDEGAYCSADRRGVPDPLEREALARYLESAAPALMGYRTDGVWVWPEASAHHLRARGGAPDDDLLRHIESVGYRAPAAVPKPIRTAAEALVHARPATGARAAAYFVETRFTGQPPGASGVLLRRYRTDAGHQRDERLNRRSLRWEPTTLLIVNDRNGERDYDAIPARVAARIADDWWVALQP